MSEPIGGTTTELIAALRARLAEQGALVARLREALLRCARELEAIQNDDPCPRLHQTAEGQACVDQAMALLAPGCLAEPREEGDRR